MSDQPSRQRLYQLRKQALGLCTQCGQAAARGMQRCEPCADKLNAYKREQSGFAPWKPGGRGRPPNGA